MGRPRQVSDAEIIDAATAVLYQEGPADLTLQKVAQVVGVTAPALVQRFRSRRSLLLAVAEAKAEGLRFKAADISERQVDVLLENLLDYARPLANPLAMANHLAFLSINLADAEFRSHAVRHNQRMRYAITRALQEAQDDDEINTLLTPAELAGLLQTMYWGLLLEWGFQIEDMTLEQHLERNLKRFLLPYFRGRDG